MLECPACGRNVPRVHGEAEQVCPHCGARVVESGGGDGAGVVARRSSRRGDRGRPNVGNVVRRAMAFYRDHPGPVLLLWLAPALAAVGLLVAAATYAPVVQDLADRAEADDLTEAERLAISQEALAPIGAIFGALAVVVAVGSMSLGATLALVRGSGASLEGGSGPESATLLDRLPALVMVSLLFSLLVTVGLVLFFLPGLLAIHWFLFAMFRVVEGDGVGEALRSSRRLVRGNRTWNLTLFVLLAGFVLDTFGGALNVAARATGLADPTLLGSGVEGLVLWIVGPVIPLAMALYYTRVAEAGGAEGGGFERVPTELPTGSSAPGGVGTDEPAAGGREFHTVRCPDCGTIVPFYVEGEETRVECPTCGKVGIVRRGGR